MQTPLLPRADASVAPSPRVAAAHPSPEDCERFAQARMRASEGLLLRVHLELCADCRARTLTVASRLRAETQNAVEADRAPAGPRGALLALRRAAWTDHDDAVPRTALSSDSVFEADALAELPWRVPSEVRAVLFDADAPLAWRTVAPGVSVIVLPATSDGAAISLLRLAPQTSAPRHRHHTSETIQVLHGGFADHLGVHHAGDYLQYSANGESHVAVALPSAGPCIVLLRTASVLQSL